MIAQSYIEAPTIGRCAWSSSYQPAKDRTMRDLDVRKALHRKVLKEHHGDTNTLVIDELGLRHGACRVDIAVVNGYLHGFEIKSDSDTLERLPAQIAVYNTVLDRATLVVGEKHASKAQELLPDWWGVKIAYEGPRGGIDFSQAKNPQLNQAIDPIAISELLWKDEVVSILRDLGTPEVFLRKPRGALYRQLAEVVELKDLRDLMRRTLRARAKWRGHRPPSSDAGSSIPIPT
jgi:hypothetical protein